MLNAGGAGVIALRSRRARCGLSVQRSASDQKERTRTLLDRMKWPLKPTPEQSRWLKDGRTRVQSGWKAFTDADEAIDEEEYQRHVAEFFGDRPVTREQLWAWLQAPHSWFVSEKADAQKVIKRGSELLSGSAFSRWCDDCLQMVQVLDEVSKNVREHVVIHATMRGENLLMTIQSPSDPAAVHPAAGHPAPAEASAASCSQPPPLAASRRPPAAVRRQHAVAIQPQPPAAAQPKAIRGRSSSTRLRRPQPSVRSHPPALIRPRPSAASQPQHERGEE